MGKGREFIFIHNNDLYPVIYIHRWGEPMQKCWVGS